MIDVIGYLMELFVNARAQISVVDSSPDGLYCLLQVLLNVQLLSMRFKVEPK